jgi:hypothetical protein
MQAMKADFKIMKDVAVHTRVSPDERQKSVNQFLTRVRECPKAMEILGDWGLKLAMAAEPIQVTILNGKNYTLGSLYPYKYGYRDTFGIFTCTRPVGIKSVVYSINVLKN